MPVAPRPALDRLAPKIAVDDNGCWIWLGATIRSGYGHFHVDGKYVKTHRWTYEHFVGPIPDGMQIDHLCRVVACCNPGHLEPVTPLENIRRSAGNATRTHCRHGHAFDAENTIWLTRASGRAAGQRYRRCRECSIATERRRGERRRQRRAALCDGNPCSAVTPVLALVHDTFMAQLWEAS